MIVTLQDEDSNIYTFPSEFKVKTADPYPIQKRSDTVARAFSDGEEQIGDMNYQKRRIIVSGRVATSTWAADFSAFFRQFDKTDIFQLRWTDNRFAYVRSLNVDLPDLLGPEGSERTSKFSFEFEMADPYFYSNSQYSDDIDIYFSGTSFTFHNDSDMRVFPVFTLTALADINWLSLTNVTDQSKVMFYRDTDMLNGTVAVINTNTGRVTLDGVNTIARFAGTFLSLVQGDNLIAYDSGVDVIGKELNLQLDFYGRYLHPEGPDIVTVEIDS